MVVLKVGRQESNKLHCHPLHKHYVKYMKYEYVSESSVYRGRHLIAW